MSTSSVVWMVLYILESQIISSRVAAHNSGKGAKYTRNRIPVEMVYQEECSDKSTALHRELEIKRMTREEKLKLIARDH